MVRHMNTKVVGGYEAFKFDHVFGPKASQVRPAEGCAEIASKHSLLEPQPLQEFVYDAVAKPLVSHMLRGSDAAVLAYGATGTGKT